MRRPAAHFALRLRRPTGGGVRLERGGGLPRGLLHGLLMVSFAALLVLDVFLGTPELRRGEVVVSDIVAPRRLVNVPLYRQLEAIAARRVAPVYVADPGATRAMEQAVAAMVGRVLATQKKLGTDTNIDDQVATWEAGVGLPLPAAEIHALLGSPPAVFADLETEADVAVRHVLGSASYTVSQLPEEQDALENAVFSLMLPSRAQEDFLVSVLRQVAAPNMIYSAAETQQARRRALAAVPVPVIEPGQVILAKGTRVSESDLRLLQALGLDRSSFGPGDVAGTLVVAALVLLGVGAYVLRYREDLAADVRKTWVAAIATFLVLALARPLSQLSPLLVPIGFLAMTLGLTVSARLGVFLSLLLVLALTFVLNLDSHSALVLAASGVAGGLSVARLRDRGGLLRALMIVAGASFLTFLATALIGYPGGSPAALWPGGGYAFLSGVLSGILTLGALPFFEHGLGVLTPFRLLELSGPGHPLMRRLLVEAPGTYHHSLLVANLASAAAEAIGADGLLTRVGAYYHDIGKLRRPNFFIDNQLDGDNPHDRMSPSLSALVLASHVRDGLQMAKAARLPPEIQAFIGEHHGTTLMAYFFHRAKEQGQEVREADFRYEGPKPQSRETALVMLADGVEAATRAMADRSPEAVETLTRRLIRERLLDGQLDESDLTLRDLELVTYAFVHVLAGAYHGRVEYPEAALGGEAPPSPRGGTADGGRGRPAAERPPSP